MTLAAPAILADTSAWIEYLRATGSPVHLKMRQLVAEEWDLVTTDAVVLELLSGVQEEEVDRLRSMLLRFDHLPTHNLADYEKAAEMYRQCRRGGETIRSITDCLIAAVAVRTDAQLLHRDRDFDVLARHTPLKVVEPQ
jgi:predicted nucleic acid-binding protein